MMSIRGWFPASILYLLVVGSAGMANDEKPDAPHWLGDWEEGRKAAQASGKPLFVVFRCQH